MSANIKEINSQTEKIQFIPRSDLGQKLLELRRLAIDDGMRLLSEDEVSEEVSQRRGG